MDETLGRPYPEEVNARPASIIDELIQKKSMLESRLKVINEALEILNKNPELQKVLHLVTKASRM